MNFIKQHWFGTVIMLVLLPAVLLFLIVLFSPRQDNQKRGFIPCTENMAAELYDCGGRGFCMLGAVLSNSLCDAGVVWSGLSGWAAGKQPRPWSNYFFTPDLSPEEEPAPEVEEFYRENPHLQQDMRELEILHGKLLENQAADALLPAETPEMPLNNNQKEISENDRE